MSLLPKPSAVVFVAKVPRMTQFYQTPEGNVLQVRERNAGSSY